MLCIACIDIAYILRILQEYMYIHICMYSIYICVYIYAFLQNDLAIPPKVINLMANPTTTGIINSNTWF